MHKKTYSLLRHFFTALFWASMAVIAASVIFGLILFF